MMHPRRQLEYISQVRTHRKYQTPIYTSINTRTRHFNPTMPYVVCEFLASSDYMHRAAEFLIPKNRDETLRVWLGA